MKKILLSIFLLMTTVLSGNTITQYLPKEGILKSKIMLVGFPEDMQVLLKKYGEAVKKNDAWFKEYQQKHKGVFPMPYHKNMGLTEKEYKSFKNIATSMTLVEKEDIVLSVKRDNNATTIEVKNNPNHFLNGLKIYNNETVKTKYGMLQKKEDIERKRKSTGTWKGVEWVENITHAGNVQVVKFALGKRDRGDYVIYYDVETFTPKSKRDYGYILYKKEIVPDMQKNLIHIR